MRIHLVLIYTTPCRHKNKYVTFILKELKLKSDDLHENLSVVPLPDMTRYPAELKAYTLCASQNVYSTVHWEVREIC